MTDLAIDVRGLRKTYGELEAVRGIDFTVARGEIFALLGPNGAGKTTAVEILEGHRNRTTGEVSVLGFDPARRDRAFEERIGIVLQETGVDPYLKVEESIELFRGYYPHPRPLDELLDLVGLTEHRAMRVSKLSGGQQRRLDVAIGLAGDPDLLFLDEPTTGFDPEARRGAWETIKGLQALGKTIFLTTHYMEEAEALAGRVAIIRRGEIVAQGTPRELMSADNVTTVRFRRPEAGSILDGIEGVRLADNTVIIETVAPTAVLFELTRRARDTNIELQDLTVSRTSLEETYLRLVSEDGKTPEALPERPSRSARRRGAR
jgi:ABC-2 type transport system ATP-binding protein